MKLRKKKMKDLILDLKNDTTVTLIKNNLAVV